MDENDYLQWLQDVRRFEEEQNRLAQLYAAGEKRGIRQAEIDTILKRWRKDGRSLYKTDTQTERFVREAIKRALNSLTN